MASKITYDVLSPDGFAINATETYNTIPEAQAAVRKWVKRYEVQGYYSSNKGRIAFDDIISHCRIITL